MQIKEPTVPKENTKQPKACRLHGTRISARLYDACFLATSSRATQENGARGNQREKRFLWHLQSHKKDFGFLLQQAAKVYSVFARTPMLRRFMETRWYYYQTRGLKRQQRTELRTEDANGRWNGWRGGG